MTTDHPQHSTNPSAAMAVRSMTLNLRDLAAAQIMRGLNVAPISHKAVLAAAEKQSATAEPARKPFATFQRLNVAALIAGNACAVLVYAHSGSLLLGCATVCASLMLCLLQSSVIAYVTDAMASQEDAMDHRKVRMPEPRDARKRSVPLGEAYAHESGGVIIDCLGLVLCGYALLAVLWLFATGAFAL